MDSSSGCELINPPDRNFLFTYEKEGAMVSDVEHGDELVTILLVEPSPGDTRLFTESFKDAKLTNQLYTVSDADDALDFINQRGEYATDPKPDLILLEPNVPERTGQTSSPN